MSYGRCNYICNCNCTVVIIMVIVIVIIIIIFCETNCNSKEKIIQEICLSWHLTKYEGVESGVNVEYLYSLSLSIGQNHCP